MTVTFASDIGAVYGRVAIPGGVVSCANLSAFETELAKYTAGGANDGDSVDLYLSGTTYAEIGVENYNCTDGGTGLRLYGRLDGTTKIRYTGSGMSEAHSAVFRLGSSANNTETNTNVSLYNVELDGASTGDGVGATWACILGGSWSGDTFKGDVFDIHIQGVTIHHPRNSGIKIDGNDGTDGVTIQQCTVYDFGMQYVGQETAGQGVVEGIGEGIYCGDGNTGRSYANVLIDRCHVYDGRFGEGINVKRDGTNVVIQDCLIHDIEIDNGGGIACEGFASIYRTRVHNVTRNSNSDTGYPPLFGFEQGGYMENCMGWTEVTNGDCVALFTGSTGTVTLKHNTFVSGGGVIYRFSSATSQVLDADDNLYDGTLTGGTISGSTNDYSAGTFVGPTSGTAENGSEGYGSGFVLSSGGGRNAVTLGSVTTDIQGYSRGSTTDAGAIDADAVAPSTTAFAITAPANSATDVASPTEVSGTADSAGQDYRIRGTWTGGGDTGWQPATWSGDTWTVDTDLNLPTGGEVVTLSAKRYEP